MNPPDISLVVPLYMVEKYIERFAHSVFQQTMENIEYICVDDGSSDASVSIFEKVLSQYPSRRSWVRLIRHKENLGVVEARKAGLLAARGKYIVHIDADDWIERNYCEELYALAQKGNHDLVWCDYFRDKDGGSTYCSMAHDSDAYSLISGMINGHQPSFLWVQMAKRETYGELAEFIFPAGGMTDDLVYSVQLLLNSRSVAHLPKALYHYCHNENSITACTEPDKVVRKFHQMVQNTDQIESLLNMNNGYADFLPQLETRKMLCKDYLWLTDMSSSYRRLYIETYPETNWNCIFNRNLPLLVKFRAVCSLLHMVFLYKILQRIRQRTRKNHL